MIETKKVPLSAIKPNPKNPRTISEEALNKLVESIKKFPEMKEAREIVVNKDMVILGGNMRYYAMLKAGLTEAVVKIVDWPEEKQKEFIIKDNIANGEWDYDLLEAEWDKTKLTEWGFDFNWEESTEEKLSEDYSDNIGEVIYEPKKTNHKISDLFQAEHKFDEEIEQIKNPELKEMLKARVAYFSKFNFSKIADYYAYQATPQEQRIFEKLALVLLDRDQLIENGFSKLKKKIAGEINE